MRNARPIARTRDLLLGLALLALGGCEDELYRGLTQKDANEMAAILADSGIAASRDAADGGYRLLVDPNRFAPAVQILKSAGYPRETYRSLSDVFPGDGLITSPYEQRARMTYALDQELSRTLSEIQGVAAARVHVVVPEVDLRGSPLSRASAAVVLWRLQGIDAEELGPKVRQIVSNAVPGLNYRDVSITFFADERPASLRSAGETFWQKSAYLQLVVNGFLLLVALGAMAAGGLIAMRRFEAPRAAR